MVQLILLNCYHLYEIIKLAVKEIDQINMKLSSRDSQMGYSDTKNEHAKDFLWLNIRDLPYFRSLLRAVEAQFYEEIDLSAPTLDVGCGEGHFASLIFDRKIEGGLDPSYRVPS